MFSKARNKKKFGSGQLIFENWSGGPVDLFSFFLNHNINIPNLIVQKVLKLEIQNKPVLKTFMKQLRMQMNVDSAD